MILFRIAGALLTAWMVFFMVAGVVFSTTARLELASDPVRWLSRRGIEVEGADAVKVFWLNGQPELRYLQFRWIVGVAADDFLFLEGQIPFRLRRSRVMVPGAIELRSINGDVANKQRSWRVSSRPTTALPDELIQRGWIVHSRRL